MKNKTRPLLLILFILTINSFAQQSDNLAPEATTTEVELSFWDLPYLKDAFIDVTPTDRKDGISVGELGVDGGNKTMILKLAKEISDKKYGLYDGLLISHKSKLIFESYYLRGRVNLLHQQASATKTYTSLVLGRAIQLGYLTMSDLDKPIITFFKNVDTSNFVKGIEKITLYQALTMRGGITINNDKWKQLRENSTELKGQGLVETLFENSEPITSESQKFVYGNFNPDLVMQVIDAVVPGTAKDFIEKEFFDKIGISNYRWNTNIDSLPAAGGPSYLTSRDMLKLGELINNNGKWNKEQLISAKFLTDATSNITKAAADWHPDNFNYGYFFYQVDIKVGTKNYKANVAWGGGGQHLITVEELDLVIAITGHDREDIIFPQVSKYIIPAFVK